jgi:outer membrane protein assembly factor BamE (lipoprotein component of BamABCDE complex)
MRRHLLIIAILVSVLFGCSSAQKHRADVANQDADRISVGTVQREIRVGMSGADVVSALGSPNMVTTDDQRRETWVYDKVATEKAYSSSSGGLWLIIAGRSGRSGASSTTQRTLTIIIKFDEKGLVRDYSYRQSSF